MEKLVRVLLNNISSSSCSSKEESVRTLFGDCRDKITWSDLCGLDTATRSNVDKLGD